MKQLLKNILWLLIVENNIKDDYENIITSNQKEKSKSQDSETLQKRIIALEEQLSFLSFKWTMSFIILFDVFFLRDAKTWSFPLIIAIFQIIIIIVISRKLGISDINILINKLLESYGNKNSSDK